MLDRLSFVIAASILLSSQQIVRASPLTYDFTDPSGVTFQTAEGSITSIQAASVPEPSAMVVSAILGIVAEVYRRCHKS